MGLAVNSNNPLGIKLSLAQCKLIVSRGFEAAVHEINCDDLGGVNPCAYRGLKQFLSKPGQLNDPEVAEEVMM